MYIEVNSVHWHIHCSLSAYNMSLIDVTVAIHAAYKSEKKIIANIIEEIDC